MFSPMLNDKHTLVIVSVLLRAIFFVLTLS